MAMNRSVFQYGNNAPGAPDAGRQDVAWCDTVLRRNRYHVHLLVGAIAALSPPALAATVLGFYIGKYQVTLVSGELQAKLRRVSRDL